MRLLTGGSDALRQFRLTLFRPLLPMLAQTAPDVAAALARTGRASVETKYDGARVQVHRAGRRIAIYTRNLREVSANLPEIVAAVAHLPVAAVILDGEVIALRPGPIPAAGAGASAGTAAAAGAGADAAGDGPGSAGRPQPFQVTMSRFGRRRATPADQRELPLSAFFFDCLHLDGADLIDRPLEQRLAALDAACPQALRVPRLITDDADAAARHAAAVLAAGHEGVLVKALDGTYEAGRRGGGWIKVKPAHTLDLVVLAAEWGAGRRRGWLSNLHLGARDPQHGGFAMVGKTFKGLSDELLRWQTERLLAFATRRAGHVVFVRPELVVEMACDGVQTSTRYLSGMALRFARVRGYREDKSAGEADTVATVRGLAR